MGAGVQIGYFAQAHEELNPENTVLAELLSVREMPLSQARNYLATYLFQGDDVFRPVSTLSGGERGRLALAKLSLSGANFLLLDEPTNHLDIPSQEILQDVLDNYEGTILLVSHDRYLIDALATQIWALTPGEITVFEGPYQEYAAMKEGRAPASAPVQTGAKTEAPPERKGNRPDQPGRRSSRPDEGKGLSPQPARPPRRRLGSAPSTPWK